MGERSVILNEGQAEAMREAFEELQRGMGDLRLAAPVAAADLAEVSSPPSGVRTLMTRAAMDALAQDPAGIIASNPLRRAAHRAAMRTTVSDWAAWVEGGDDLRPVALAAFRQNSRDSIDGDTLTIALWWEVREQVLAAVAEYEQRMAGWDYAQENI